MTTDGSISGKGKRTQPTDGEPATERKKAPFAVLAVAWLIPGLGHWLLGKKTRPLCF